MSDKATIAETHRLLECHQPATRDLERDWAGPLPMSGPSLAWRAWRNAIGAWLLDASVVLSRADRPGEHGWFDIDEPPAIPADEPGEESDPEDFEDHEDVEDAAA